MSTIYIHWPFCLSKCHYCDFNSVACKDDVDFNHWLELYKLVLLKFKEEFYKGENITSVYFGGGTPSLLPVSFVDGLLSYISNNFILDCGAEITLEANPKTIDTEKANGFKNAGVNRLSIGIQSLKDDDLRVLGRTHSSMDAIECVVEMSRIFENLSIDLIYNRPGQFLFDWGIELKEALKLPIKHISLYELIIEDNTPLKKMIDQGALTHPKKDNGEFMMATINMAESFGFNQYEVSNFCKDGYDGKHNISYWRYEDYYGVGPGSHSRVSVGSQKIAIPQINDNKKWLDWAKKPIFDSEFLEEDEAFKEMLIMGLRASCGFDATKISEKIKNRYNFDHKVEKLLRNSYILLCDGKIVLTCEGLLRLNLVIEYFVGK